jgi:hypothetical protein
VAALRSKTEVIQPAISATKPTVMCHFRSFSEASTRSIPPLLQHPRNELFPTPATRLQCPPVSSTLFPNAHQPVDRNGISQVCAYRNRNRNLPGFLPGHMDSHQRPGQSYGEMAGPMGCPAAVSGQCPVRSHHTSDGHTDLTISSGHHTVCK